MLDHTGPRLHTFWTNAFVHEQRPSDSHLLGNITGYLLLVVPCWLLSLSRDKRRHFWTGFAIILTVGPLVISFSSYIAYHEIIGLEIENDRGFSGVVGALNGYLLTSIIRTFAEKQREQLASLSVGLCFGYLMLGLGALTGRVLLLVLGGLVIGVMFLVGLTSYIAAPTELAAWGPTHRGLSVVLVVAVLVSTWAFAAALPADIMASDGLTNIVAHGTGILFGMAVEPSLRHTARWRHSGATTSRS